MAEQVMHCPEIMNTLAAQGGQGSWMRNDETVGLCWDTCSTMFHPRIFGSRELGTQNFFMLKNSVSTEVFPFAPGRRDWKHPTI